jgi:hypothetical protein
MNLHNATQLNSTWIQIFKLKRISLKFNMVNVLVEFSIELNLVELNQIQFNSIQYKLVELKSSSIQIGFNWINFIILLNSIQPHFENSILKKTHVNLPFHILLRWFILLDCHLQIFLLMSTYYLKVMMFT